MLDAFLRILALTRKELLAILKDPRSRATLIIPPILQCLIYGYVASYDLNDIPYAVLDQDRSGASHDLLARLDGTGVFRRVADFDRAADLKTTINERQAILAIQIDQNFERRLLLGLSSDVQVIADGRNSNTAATAMGYVTTIVDSFNADWRAAHGIASPPIRVLSRTWYNPNLETRWTMIPSPDRPAHAAADPVVDRDVGGARTRARYVRPAARHALPSGRDYGGQGAPLDHRRHCAGHGHSRRRPALVSHPLRWIVRRPLHGTDRVPAGGGRDRTFGLGDCRDHAAGHALFVCGGYALRAVVRVRHADQQHAGFRPIHHAGSTRCDMRSTSHGASTSREPGSTC